MKTNLSRLAEHVNRGEDSTRPPEWWLRGLMSRLDHANAHMVWLERAVGGRRYWAPVLEVGAAIVTESVAESEVDRMVLRD